MTKQTYIISINLCIAFLLSCIILKVVFPTEFYLVITNERLIEVGNIIDNNNILFFIATRLTSLFTYYIYICACSRRLFLPKNEIFYILAFTILTYIVQMFSEPLAGHLRIFYMITIPLKYNASYKDIVDVYGIYGMVQVVHLFTRDLPLGIEQINFATAFLLFIEQYILLMFIYLFKNNSTGGDYVWANSVLLISEIQKTNLLKALKNAIKNSTKFLHVKLTICVNYIRLQKQKQNNKNVTELLSEAKVINDFILIKKQIMQHFIILGFLAVTILLTHKFIEMMFFCIAHTYIRYSFNKQYHTHYWKCTFITTGIVFVGVIYTFPLAISILSSIPLSIIISSIGCLVVENKELMETNNNLKLVIDKFNSFKVKNCTIEDLTKRCQLKGLTKETLEFAILAFVNKTPEKELSVLYNIEIQSVRNKKQRLKSKLEQEETEEVVNTKNLIKT